MNKKRKGVSLLLVAVFLFSVFVSAFSVPVAAENVSMEAASEEGVLESATLSGESFSISLDEIGSLTKEAVLLKAEASMSDGTEVGIDEESFNTLVSATAAGRYSLILTGGEKRLVIDVNVIEDVISEEKEAIESYGGISLREVVTGGGVTIDVPEYTAGDGFKINTVYDAKITVNFGAVATENKTVKINLPEGMRYAVYPVTGPTANIQVPAQGVLKDFMASYTAPTKNVWNTYNGELIYTFTPETIGVEIPIKIAIDEPIFYGDKLITDGIEVVASMGAGNTPVGQTSMDFNAAGNVDFRGTVSAGASINMTVLEGETVDVPGFFSNRHSAEVYERYGYFHEVTHYIHYPVGFKYVSSNADSDLVEVNDALGYAKFKYTDHSSSIGRTRAIAIQLTSVDIAAKGTYEAVQGSYAEWTTYDGAVIASSPSGKMKITVTDNIPNKVTLGTRDGYYYAYSSDYQSYGPLIRFENDVASVKTNQWIEVKVPTGYLASEVGVPFDEDTNGGVVKEFWYSTSSNPTLVKANSSEIQYSTKNAFVSRTSLGLAPNEYITEAKVSIGDVSKSFFSTNPNAVWTANHQGRVVGKLDSGISAVTFEVSMYAENAGVEEPGTRDTQYPTVIRDSAPSTSIKRIIPTTTAIAGKTKEVTLKISAEYFYGNFAAMTNPYVYLQVPDGISYSNVRIVDSIGGATAMMSSPYTTTEGYQFVRITTNAKAGAFFGANERSVIEITFDVTVSPQAKGASYSWSDLVFVTDHVSDITKYIGFPDAVSDIYDVNMDGDLTQPLAPAANNNLVIVADESLIIDTYIKPVGEGKKPPYDPTDPDTAVGFTPGTHADYIVDIFNNNVAPAKNIITYIPVPKEGNNFGAIFQKDSFPWNMKLGSVPTLHVEDVAGNDITSTASNNYEISYTTGATNGSNYEGAVYSTTFDAGATMIKVTNTTGMDRGERAYLTFDYVVDEDAASLALKPQKLESINAFNPYYHFESGGTSGAIKGTSAGARLEIGQIAGIVFEDVNKNGVYDSGVDQLVSGKTVKLLKKDVGGVYQDVTTIVTSSNGEYSFGNLGNGDYQIDFSNVKTSGQKFTHLHAGSEISLDSDVPFNGSDEGKASSIDPTTNISKHISAGVIDYAAPTVDITKATTTIQAVNSQQPNISEELAKTIGPSYFDSIKATANSVVWSSSDSTTIEVFSDGFIKGLQAGTATVSLTVTDMYGGTATDTIIVTVTSNDIPTITGSNHNVEKGSTFVPWTGITVADTEDAPGALTKEVTVNTVNTSALGQYDVTYKVTDSDGNTATLSIKVTVVDTTAPTLTIVNDPIYVEKDSAKTEAQLKSMAGVSATDEGIVTLALNQSAVDYSNEGSYTVTVTATDDSSNVATDTFDVIVVDPLTAKNFTIDLNAVGAANFVTLADAKGWDVVTNPSLKAPSTVTLKSAKPTTVGVHDVTFKAATGKEITVKVLVTNEPQVGNEGVTATGFTVKLSEVVSANFVTLAGAKGWDVTNPANPVEIPVTLVSAKPTTLGVHTVRFETAGGGWAEVPVLVTNEAPVNKEAVTATNFAIALDDVESANFVTLANATGWNIADINNPVQIPVLLVSSKPTTVGIHTARFETAGGGWAEVKVYVGNEVNGNEVIMANDFEVDLVDMASTDFVALADAKAYDMTDLNNPVSVTVALTSAKPAIPGKHTAAFETAAGTKAEVGVRVTDSSRKTYLAANDVVMTVSEFNDAKVGGNLEQYVIEKSKARAWSESDFTGTEERDVFMDSASLLPVSAPTSVTVDVYTYEPDEINYRALRAKPIAASKEITISIIKDPVTEKTGSANSGSVRNVSQKGMPRTGGSLILIMGGLAIALGSVVILGKRKRDK